MRTLTARGHKQLLLKCGLLSEKYSLGVRVPKDVEVQEEFRYPKGAGRSILINAVMCVKLNMGLIKTKSR